MSNFPPCFGSQAARPWRMGEERLLSEAGEGMPVDPQPLGNVDGEAKGVRRAPETAGSDRAPQMDAGRGPEQNQANRLLRFIDGQIMGRLRLAQQMKPVMLQAMYYNPRYAQYLGYQIGGLVYQIRYLLFRRNQLLYGPQGPRFNNQAALANTRFRGGREAYGGGGRDYGRGRGRNREEELKPFEPPPLTDVDGKHLEDVADRQVADANRLDKERTAARTVSPELRKFLDMAIGVGAKGESSDTKMKFSLVKIDAPDTSAGPAPQYAVQVAADGKRVLWYISEQRMYSSPPMPFNANNIIALRKRSDPLTQGTLRLGDVQRGGTTAADALQRTLQTAEANRKSEKEGAGDLNKFDLPKRQKICYLAFCDKKTTQERRALAAIPQEMKRRGYEYQTLGNGVIQINQDPIGTMAKCIQAAYGKGTRYFHLALVPHGVTDGLVFQGPGEPMMVTAQELAGLRDRFPDAKFLTDISSCYAGGSDFVKAHVDEKGTADNGRSVTVFHTKTLAANVVLQRKGGHDERSSPYHKFLLKYLREKKTYGEAHRLADLKVKEIYPGIDAGVIFSAKKEKDVKRIAKARPARELGEGGKKEELA